MIRSSLYLRFLQTQFFFNVFYDTYKYETYYNLVQGQIGIDNWDMCATGTM